jgi:hypothetical protein
MAFIITFDQPQENNLPMDKFPALCGAIGTCLYQTLVGYKSYSLEFDLILNTGKWLRKLCTNLSTLANG